MAKEPLKVLTESMFYVLLSLLHQERCGAEIVQYVDDTTVGRVPLGPGTLYTILAKFQEEGLIVETAVGAASAPMPSRTGAGPCSGRNSAGCAFAWRMANGRGSEA